MAVKLQEIPESAIEVTVSVPDCPKKMLADACTQAHKPVLNAAQVGLSR